MQMSSINLVISEEDNKSKSALSLIFRVGVKYSTCTWPKTTLYLASNFQVLFIKKCKSSYLFRYIIITVSILGTNY